MAGVLFGPIFLLLGESPSEIMFGMLMTGWGYGNIITAFLWEQEEKIQKGRFQRPF